MKLIIFYGTIFAMTFFSCNSQKDYFDLGNEAINLHASHANEESGWVLAGSGGAWTTDLRTFTLHYFVYQEVNIPEARSLYVKSVDQFLNSVNSNTDIRPYLRDFPSTWKNVDLKISFCKPGTAYGEVLNGYVASMSVINGNLCYWAYDEQKRNLVDLFDEPYEEAARIVHEQL